MSSYQDSTLDNVEIPDVGEWEMLGLGTPLVQSPDNLLFPGPNDNESPTASWAPASYPPWNLDGSAEHIGASYLSRSHPLTVHCDYIPSFCGVSSLQDATFAPSEAVCTDFIYGSRYNTDELSMTPSLTSYPELNPLDGFVGDSQPMVKTESIFSGTSNYSLGSAAEQDDYYMDDDQTSRADIFDLEADCFASSSASKPIRRHSNKKGRKGPLTPAKKESTAYMRKIKACALCRKRKISCDDGIPCRACVKHLGGKLRSQPCRGEQLKDLTSEIMRDNAFPKGPWERFLPNGFHLSDPVYRIFLDLGFGQPLRCFVQLVNSSEDQGQQSALLHQHIEYPWPPQRQQPIRGDRQDPVFPAVLAISSEAQMQKEIDSYLTILINHPDRFMFFPLWKSELQVLKLIYDYYSKLPANCRTPLDQALKLLMLIHVGGDLRVQPEANSISIARHYFPTTKLDKVTPCFIRAQLGPIFSEMSHRYMRDVLMELERLSPTEEAEKFPMIISTFSVLLMAMESLQYHVAKLPYHLHHDRLTVAAVTAGTAGEPETRNLDAMDKSDILIRFYKATNCHARLRGLGSLTNSSDTYEFMTGVSCDVEATKFLTSLHRAILVARPHLIDKRQRSVVPGTDMTAFFDRLLSKMYLIGP